MRRRQTQWSLTEPEHHLIVAHEVINTGSDRHPLATMAKQAQEAMRSEELTAVADRGYFTGEELLACEEAGITTDVPKPHTSGNEAKGLFPVPPAVFIDP